MAASEPVPRTRPAARRHAAFAVTFAGCVAAFAAQAEATPIFVGTGDGLAVPGAVQPVVVRPWPGAGPLGEDLETLAVVPAFDHLGVPAAFLVLVPSPPTAALWPVDLLERLAGLPPQEFAEVPADDAEPEPAPVAAPPVPEVGHRPSGCVFGRPRRGGGPVVPPTPEETFVPAPPRFVYGHYCAPGGSSIPSGTSLGPPGGEILTASGDVVLGPYLLRLFPPGERAALAGWLLDHGVTPPSRLEDLLDRKLDGHALFVAAIADPPVVRPGPRILPPLALTFPLPEVPPALLPPGGLLVGEAPPTAVDLFTVADEPWRIPDVPLADAGYVDRRWAAVAALSDERGVLVRQNVSFDGVPLFEWLDVVPDLAILLEVPVPCPEPPASVAEPPSKKPPSCDPGKRGPSSSRPGGGVVSCRPDGTVGVPDLGDVTPDCAPDLPNGGDLVPDCGSDFGDVPDIGGLTPDCTPTLPDTGGYVPGCAASPVGPYLLQILFALWLGRRLSRRL
jgi:hypothetical protein